MRSGPQTTIGPYRLDGLLGRGGMGEVFRAYDQRRLRTVALKLLPQPVSADNDFRERFRRESLTAAALTSPHVVPIHDFGEVEGQLFMDMRLIDGADLSTIIARGPLDPRRAIKITAQVGEALTDAHNSGIIHRDVKPSNILLTDDDFAYLVDFGIALTSDLMAADGLTRTGTTVGTFGYMAPERFESSTRADERADIYSLSCVLSEMLTGQRPFAEQQSAPALIRAHLLDAPVLPHSINPDIPVALDSVIARGLAKNPDERFNSVAEFCGAAERAVSGRSTAPATSSGLTSFASSLPKQLQRDIPTRIGHEREETSPRASTKAAAPTRFRRMSGVVLASVLLLAVGVAGGIAVSGQRAPNILSNSSSTQVSAQVVGQSTELPADLQGRWKAYTLSDLGRIEVTLVGGEVDEEIGSATTNPMSLIRPGISSPAPCSYGVELISALSGDRGDKATIRLVVGSGESRPECATSATMNLERLSSSYVQIQPGGELCFKACKPAQIGGTLQPA